MFSDFTQKAFLKLLVEVFPNNVSWVTGGVGEEPPIYSNGVFLEFDSLVTKETLMAQGISERELDWYVKNQIVIIPNGNYIFGVNKTFEPDELTLKLFDACKLDKNDIERLLRKYQESTNTLSSSGFHEFVKSSEVIKYKKSLIKEILK